MEQRCFPAGLDGQGLAYGVNIQVRGLTPSASFTLKLDEFDIGTGEWRGSIGPAQFAANPKGIFGPFGYGAVRRYPDRPTAPRIRPASHSFSDRPS
jgi:hypothetical protein